ncbi:Ubiquitin-conjugating enzyme E2 4 [Madurella mycetomatis]|uniref:Ubiquitin-conjugating enzyme E2 4 n=1 Tax=Madurella mycetomatis TaxID=100816 RepID=A0A175W5Q4_9PEZI|nr:Ubiquitin-conjugating enzyme E2 4 [Madurella mycetomatis]KXX78895.1 Ubiquitin-conjugating enzyme E2 4 [Madurella mycetomatis]
MEVVGLTASIIAVGQLTSACLKLSGKYLGRSEHGTNEIKALQTHLYNFNGVLRTFETHVEIHEDDTARLESLRCLKPVLDACKDALECIKGFLGNTGFIGKYILGPKFDRQLKPILKVLDNAKEVFTLAVYADHLTIISGVDQYIRNVSGDVQELRSLAVETKESLAHLIQAQQRQVELTNALLDQQNVQRLQEERRTVLDWLTKLDFAPQYYDFLDRRQPGTGRWLLNSGEYTAWVAASTPTLFCRGIPGSGKTILSAIVIEDLKERFKEDGSVAVVYLFFDFKRQFEQEPRELLSSLARQLVQHQEAVPKSVRELYKKHRETGKVPDVKDMSATLQTLISPFRRVFLVVDALDECRPEGRCRSIFLEQISELQSNTNVSCFLTSRHIPEIEAVFTECSSLEILATGEDIGMYLEGHMDQLPRFVFENQGLRKQIQREIISAVDGMFLLAQLYLRALEDKTTVKAVKTTLSKFKRNGPGSTEDAKARTLAEAYGQAMARIQNQRAGFRQLAEKVLAWITCATRPLQTTEFQHALAVEIGERQFDEENMPQLDQIISVCSGLVTIDKQSNVVRLIHYTAQEYLSQTKGSWFPAAEAEICITCVTYLSYDVFSQDSDAEDRDFEQLLQSYPFSVYAACNWATHARNSDDSAVKTAPVVIGFLECVPNVKFAFHAMGAGVLADGKTGLHLAARVHLDDTLSALLARGHNPNATDWQGWTPLAQAAHEGRESIVTILLGDSSVAVNKGDHKARTPLMHAAMLGHVKVVEQFLKLDASRIDVDARDRHGNTALWLAAKEMRWDVVHQFLNDGRADLSVEDSHGETLMTLAVRRAGRGVHVAERLAALGFPLPPDYSDGLEPLRLATQRGDDNEREMLCQRPGPAVNRSYVPATISTLKRITYDIKDLNDDLPSFVGPVRFQAEDLYGTPYELGVFHLCIQYPVDYPVRSMQVRFTTPIMHPNITAAGEIDLQIFGSDWRPSLTLSKVLLSIVSLLDKPLEGSTLPEYTRGCAADPEAYKARAREWTKKYARPD